MHRTILAKRQAVAIDRIAKALNIDMLPSHGYRTEVRQLLMMEKIADGIDDALNGATTVSNGLSYADVLSIPGISQKSIKAIESHVESDI